MTIRFLLRAATVAAAVALTGGAHAALTAYTTQTSFLAVISSPGVDTFAGLSTNSSTPSPLTRTAGSYTYKAESKTDNTPSSFFGANTSSDPWLSTNENDDMVVFSAFSGGVSGIGGNFFGSDVDGKFLAGDVTLVAVDSLGATSTRTITNATTSSFVGFKSTGTIVSLTLMAVQTPAGLWPTADNLTLGVSAIPEPGTYALMLAGLAVVGTAGRRRRG